MALIYNITKFAGLGAFSNFVLVGACLYFTLRVVLQRQKKDSKKPQGLNVPYVKWTPFRMPFIDGLIFPIMGRIKGIQWLEKKFSKYGLIFEASLLNCNLVALLNPADIQKVLSSPTHLNKPSIIYELAFTYLLKGGLLSSDVNTWMPHRKALSPAFTYKAYPTYVKIMQDACIQLVTKACAKAQTHSHGVCDMETIKEFLDQANVMIILSIIMGSDDCNITHEEQQKLYKEIREFKDLSIQRTLQPLFFFEPIWMLHPSKRKLDTTIKSLRNYVNKVTDEYRLKIISNPDRKLSVEYQEESDCGIKPFECLIEHMVKSNLTNKEIMTEMCTFIGAGYETTNISLDFIIFHLAKHHEIQEKCQAEIDALMERKSQQHTKTLTLDDLASLKYLQQCVLESLRITPTVPMFLRLLEEPVTLDNGYVLEAGRSFMGLPWLVHRNPDLYPDPEKFDPDRFLPENVKQRHPYAFIPFSMGQRNCIGNKVALLEMKIIMMHLLRYFSFTTEDNLNDVKIAYEITIKPERLFNVKFHRREGIVLEDS